MAVNARFRANLTSPIHRLPNELIAHIFVMGCPAPNHKLEGIDTAPFRYQVLVGSICRLWRETAHQCPSLWTSVAAFYPARSRGGKKLAFYEEMMAEILGRSGTLELDLSLRISWFSVLGDYDHVIPHFQRVHTLHVKFERSMDFPLSTHTPAFTNLRHLYAKGYDCGTAGSLPSFGENFPLESLYYETDRPLNVSTLPTSRLRYCHIFLGHVSQQTIQLINKCSDLRVLELWGDTWDPDTLISSSTLTHVDLHVWGELPFRGPVAQGLPNLLHLRLEVDDAFELPIHPLSWTPLPSLRSLSIRFGRDGLPDESYGAHLVEILRGAPRLVALQIDEIDAPEVIEFISTHWEEEIGDGLRRKPLRLLILMIQSQEAETTWGDLPHIAPLLYSWDHDAQDEWCLKRCINPIKIGGGEVRREDYDAAFQTPLSVLADQIAD